MLITYLSSVLNFRYNPALPAFFEFLLKIDLNRPHGLRFAQVYK